MSNLEINGANAMAANPWLTLINNHDTKSSTDAHADKEIAMALSQPLPNKPIVICEDIEKLSKEEWLDTRRSVNGGFTIGGSEASIVAGVNPWQTRLELYKALRGEPLEYERELPEHLFEMGNKYEDEIAVKYGKMTGNKVFKDTRMYQNPNAPFQIANFDRRMIKADKKNVGVEIKWTDSMNFTMKDLFRKGSVPIYYEMQCRQYMAISGLDEWHIVLGSLDGNIASEITNIEAVVLYRDLDIEQAMIEEQREFIEKCKAGIPPSVADTESTEMALTSLSRVYGKGIKGKSVELPEACKGVMEKIALLQKQEKEYEKLSKAAEKEKKEYWLVIADLLGDAEGGYLVKDGKKYVAKFTNRSSTRANADLLRKDYPDMWDVVKKQSHSKSLSVEITEGI